MEFLLILLGLFPLFIFGDMIGDFDFGSEDDEAEGNGAGYQSMTETQSILEGPGFGAEQESTADPLSPVTEDETPVEGSHIDPSTVLQPNTDDETPSQGDEVDPDDVIGPSDTPEEEFFIDGDGTSLQQLLDTQSDATTGIGFLGTQVDVTQDWSLGEGDQSATLDDDGLEGTGEGALSDWDGTPIIQTEGTLNVIDGGAGNDDIMTGDEAAYAFGGEGDDTLATGEGAAALFGGEGDDTLLGAGSASYLDGGSGDDVIQGGSADEIIRGGAHGPDDAETDDNDTLDGGGGDDQIAGGYGADTLSGGTGDDVINHHGRAEEDVVAEHQEFGWHIDGDADTLDGGAGNDTLIMDGADTATGGSGADTFWLYNDGGGNIADITDFKNGEDTLRITLDPELDWGGLDVDITASLDGLDGIVSVNGEAVALLRGGAGAGTSDIFVELGQNILAG